ncbi:MAG: glycerol-3-phosphate 1-O-acyltransferase PlsY [Notoacmeibacter sp.]|nr:glycerol-3-phosphate 1-O-acyltransferase PlsY [Notoacmeibacter sp.]
MNGVELTADWFWAAVALVLGYLCGSIPFGLLITRAAGLGDVRTIGSGNIGATNVLRAGNRTLAALTLLADALKGALPVLVMLWLATRYGWSILPAMAAGLGAFLGHLYPVWIGFKGGKGVATYLGVLIAMSWQGAVAFAVVWLGMALVFRFSSLAALTAAVTVPLVLLRLGMVPLAILFAAMSVIIFIKHRANISRLLSGTESRIGSKG